MLSCMYDLCLVFGVFLISIPNVCEDHYFVTALPTSRQLPTFQRQDKVVAGIHV